MGIIIGANLRQKVEDIIKSSRIQRKDSLIKELEEINNIVSLYTQNESIIISMLKKAGIEGKATPTNLMILNEYISGLAERLNFLLISHPELMHELKQNDKPKTPSKRKEIPVHPVKTQTASEKQSSRAKLNNTKSNTSSYEAENEKDWITSKMLIFDTYYNRMVSAVNKFGMCANAAFELIPYMFVIVDYFKQTVTDEKYKELYRKLTFPLMYSFFQKYLEKETVYNTTGEELLGKRIVFYSDIINRRIEPRKDFYFSDSNQGEFDDFYVNRMSFALCDMLTNPDCGLDYEKAGIAIYGIDMCINITTNLWYPILGLSLDFIKDMFYETMKEDS